MQNEKIKNYIVKFLGKEWIFDTMEKAQIFKEGIENGVYLFYVEFNSIKNNAEIKVVSYNAK